MTKISGTGKSYYEGGFSIMLAVIIVSCRCINLINFLPATVHLQASHQSSNIIRKKNCRCSEMFVSIILQTGLLHPMVSPFFETKVEPLKRAHVFTSDSVLLFVDPSFVRGC
ncbi:uncharacterized protein EV154DRAFT_486983 [Mucor mucedo]|uniref:uncharacterized protein n=1 Tax=Mucor mucedo TaxID=29922 RepID=UPI00221EFCF7|nr:uncharacterized protein EV154DRAFT_486983 [Mucor mucedo]KAI7874075.1 hypothetical protein EV154DRAFT_486983 [Mucor mucedo]